MTSELVNVNFSLPKWQAIKIVFFAPWKSNMGYDQYTVPNNYSCWTYFGSFPLALANIRPRPLMHSFKFLWRTVLSKPTTIPFRIVACTFSANLSWNIAVCRVLIMNIIGKGQNPLLCHLSLDNTEVLSNRSFAPSPFMWYKTPLLESTRKMQSEKTNKGN